MKKHLLILLLCLVQQGFTQSNPSFSTVLFQHPISDFYGLNGQNVLIPNSCFADPDVRTEILKAKPSYLRYPGGEDANFWDWQEGWFFRNMENLGPMSMQMKYQSKNRLVDIFTGANLNFEGGNYIKDFKNALAQTGTKPLFVLNPLTSDINYQLSMLLEAKYQNLKVKRVEIGNEFYLSKVSYIEKFPDPESYATLCADWRNKIHDYLGNDVQVSAVASNQDYSGSTNERRESWNSRLFNALGTNTDSYNIHQYKAGTSSDAASLNYKSIYAKVNSDINNLNTYISQLGSVSPIWITEYNLFDKNDNLIHGTWYHALYDSYLTLKFLENQRITGCNLHAQSGNYVFGNFYNTTNGLGGWDEFESCISPPSTTLNGRTSVGIAMELVAKALSSATNVRVLGVGNIPAAYKLSDQTSPVYAIYIEKGTTGDRELLILNLSDNEFNSFDASLSSLGLTNFDSHDIYSQISLDDPALYATGNGDDFKACSGSTIFTLLNTNFLFPSSQLITLRKFSITRIHDPRSLQNRTIYAQNDTINSGSSTILMALDCEGYNVHWSTGSDSSYITVSPTSNTNYTVTYTPIDTTNSNVITVNRLITVMPPLTISIINSQSSYCKGSSPIFLNTVVSGGNSGPLKYVWITSPVNKLSSYINKGVGNTSSISVSPDESTKYIVYVTDGVQVAKAETVIYAPGAVQLKPEYVICTISLANSIELQQTAQANVTYTFQINGGPINTISTVVNDPIVIAPIAGSSSSSQGTITINSNYASGTCISSTTAILTQFECCATGNNFVIPPGSNVNDLKSALGTLANIVSNHKMEVDCLGSNTIYFNGDFHVFDNEGQTPLHDIITELEFKRCNLLFSEGASIVVSPEYSLIVNDVVMDASCDKLWKGIILDNASIVIEADASPAVTTISKILNAEFGINSLCGSSLKIRRCKFIDNIVGINSNELSANGNNIQHFTFISASEFNSTYNFWQHTPYFNMQTTKGDRGMAGMRLKNVVANIGRNPAGSGCNYFHNLNSGVIAVNSALSLVNNVFEDMIPDVTYNSQSIGTAISNIDMGGFAMTLVDGYYNSNGLPGTVTMTMNNCDIGVESINTELSVKNCSMGEMKKGIFAANTFDRSIDILYNNIIASDVCIDLLGNDFANSILVKSNNLEADDTRNELAHGIRAWEINRRSGGAKNSFSVLCNYINVKHGTNGIVLGNVDYANVAENSVIQNEPNIPGIAYHFINSNFGIVANNQSFFDAELHAFELNSGFMFENSQRFEIAHNYAYNCRYGFDFLGQCSGTDFNQNRMENHFTGLHLNDLTTIDDQVDKGNLWFGNYGSGFGAENESWISIPNGSSFFVNASQGTMFNPIIPTLQNGWFQLSLNLALFPNTVLNCNNEKAAIAFKVEPSDSLTMMAVAVDPAYYTESLTNASKSLYEKFAMNDSVLNSSIDYQNYYDSLSVKSSGKLSANRLNLSSKMIFSSVAIQSSENDSMVYGLKTQLVANNIIENSISSEIYNAYNRICKNGQTNALTLGNYLDSVHIINNNIYPNNIVNENEKELNEIESAHKLKCSDNFTLSEIAIVSSIAFLCPREGGASVYRARAIMLSIDPTATYSDDSQCNVILARKRGCPIIEKNEIVFYPNRVNHELKFAIKSTLNEAYAVKVYDVVGRQVLDWHGNPNKSEFAMPFNEANNGIYFLEVSGSNCQNYTFKFVW